MSEATRRAAYLRCKELAEASVIDVRHNVRSHDTCTVRTSWGAMANGMATACADHTSCIVDGPVIDNQTLCTVADCVNISTWGLSGKQPTHCRDHGPLTTDRILAIQRNSVQSVPRSAADGDVEGPSAKVKAECYF